MDATKGKTALVEKAKLKIMKAVMKSEPVNRFGEGWPWCQGIFYQPVHPAKNVDNNKV
jgi:hypothetical protein